MCSSIFSGSISAPAAASLEMLQQHLCCRKVGAHRSMAKGPWIGVQRSKGPTDVKRPHGVVGSRSAWPREFGKTVELSWPNYRPSLIALWRAHKCSINRWCARQPLQTIELQEGSTVTEDLREGWSGPGVNEKMVCTTTEDVQQHLQWSHLCCSCSDSEDEQQHLCCKQKGRGRAWMSLSAGPYLAGPAGGGLVAGRRTDPMRVPERFTGLLEPIIHTTGWVVVLIVSTVNLWPTVQSTHAMDT